MTWYEGELASPVVTAPTLEPLSQCTSPSQTPWHVWPCESHLIFLGLNVFSCKAGPTVGADPVGCGEAKGVSSVLRAASVTQKCHFYLPWLGSPLTANFQFRGQRIV